MLFHPLSNVQSYIHRNTTPSNHTTFTPIVILPSLHLSLRSFLSSPLLLICPPQVILMNMLNVAEVAVTRTTSLGSVSWQVTFSEVAQVPLFTVYSSNFYCYGAPLPYSPTIKYSQVPSLIDKHNAITTLTNPISSHIMSAHTPYPSHPIPSTRLIPSYYLTLILTPTPSLPELRCWLNSDEQLCLRLAAGPLPGVPVRGVIPPHQPTPGSHLLRARQRGDWAR